MPTGPRTPMPIYNIVVLPLLETGENCQEKKMKLIIPILQNYVVSIPDSHPFEQFHSDCLHRVFSDYNPPPIRIHIPIYDDPCRKDLCSGDHLHLYKRHHHRVTTVCSSLLFTVSTTKSVSLMRLYVLSSLIPRDTLIFCRRG